MQDLGNKEAEYSRKAKDERAQLLKRAAEIKGGKDNRKARRRADAIMKAQDRKTRLINDAVVAQALKENVA
jgi:hypothetical protein